jgi:hypothetical protein
MTAMIIANSIAAAAVVAGLAVSMRLGYLSAGGRFDRVAPRLELHRASDSTAQASQRRAA